MLYNWSAAGEREERRFLLSHWNSLSPESPRTTRCFLVSSANEWPNEFREITAFLAISSPSFYPVLTTRRLDFAHAYYPLFLYFSAVLIQNFFSFEAYRCTVDMHLGNTGLPACVLLTFIPVFLVLKGPLVSFCRFDLGRWYHPAGSVQGVIQTEKDSLQTTADWAVLHHWEQVRCLFSSNSFVTKGHVDL